MKITIHANATTTPAIRKMIQSSSASVSELAEEHGVSERTVRRWKGRTSVVDRSHRPHTLATSLSLVEEALVVELRTTVGLSLDDITEVIKRCVNPSLSRSAIHRCLKRHGISRTPKDSNPAPYGVFEDCGVGFIHIDLKHLTKLEARPAYVFVAIDRATRFVYIEIVSKRDAITIAGCLERFIAAFPHKINVILTDNGSEFTDRFRGAQWRSADQRKPSGNHAFDRVCRANGIKHRLTKPFRPQTNGLAERFNRRLGEAIAAKCAVAKNEGKNKFLCHNERNEFLYAFVSAYNRTRLRCLDYMAPLEAMSNLPGHNTCAAMTIISDRRAARTAVVAT